MSIKDYIAQNPISKLIVMWDSVVRRDHRVEGKAAKRFSTPKRRQKSY